MILGAVIQQPSDRIDYDFDVSSLFNGDSDSVVGVAATAFPVGLNVVALISDTDRVKVWIDGGTNGVEYTVEVTITSTNGRIKQDELIVTIEEF